MPLDIQGMIREIDATLAEYQGLAAKSHNDDYSDQPDRDVARVATRLASAVNRLAPPGSYFRQNLEAIEAENRGGYPGFKMDKLVGALTALKEEYQLGHFRSFAELVHADTAGSFIEMARDLHGQGYKDPAVVIAGSVLEQHLRDLCTKNQISLIQANGGHKKADTLNAELAKTNVYGLTDQKSVTAWLGLRNDAAHGRYSTYTQQQVLSMIQAVEDFMARHPA
jgi:hypothetical protein